ncbi:MAG: LamG-like jellyroll fold domain-containing protein [Verrucomicrobiota bacterium JB024]|nr:LamG-like jellyroll fold domain-containing protein [Verrucomicrobiota bacterium JB024]
MITPKIPLVLLLAVCCSHYMQAQTLSDYELTITSPLDGGSGPGGFFSNTTQTTGVNGNMYSTGTNTTMVAYRLATYRANDFFGNVNYAYVMGYYDGGHAVSQSGSTDYLASANGTVSMLFQTSNDVSTFQSLLNRGIYNAEGNDAFEIRVGNGRLQIAYGGTSLYNIDTSISAETWYYLGISWDLSEGSNNLTYYYGEAGSGDLQSGTITISSTGDPAELIYIGGRDGNSQFLGALEEIAIWDRTLSDSSLEAQYAATVPEPATIGMLLGATCLGLVLLRRKHQ